MKRVIKMGLSVLMLTGSVFAGSHALANQGYQSVDAIPAIPADCGPNGKKCRLWKERANKLEPLAKLLDSKNNQLEANVDALEAEVVDANKKLADIKTYEPFDVLVPKAGCVAGYDANTKTFQHNAVTQEGDIIQCFPRGFFQDYLAENEIVMDLNTKTGQYLNRMRQRFGGGFSIVRSGDFVRMIIKDFDLNDFRIRQQFSLRVVESFPPYSLSTRTLYADAFRQYIPRRNDGHQVDTELGLAHVGGRLTVVENFNDFPAELAEASRIMAEMISDISKLPKE
ncbi:hypothetical protein JQC92_14160 [Shewanella sp. 202IG2-18]|uniref:hypothetical protein n=1 Tax=Parashewanella hymeniacidonis TaxID=2807618 RepID=UPI00196201DC|nr:hypothetical protein [Parashewanella hymeniacidonis]MBM7073156.1 hypothetical protein [Parashewanella hymeniacidonis]